MNAAPPRLPTRRFGRTGLAMPVLTCGGMRFQYSWKDEEAGGITPEGQANLEACVRRAFEIGARHFETARGYGTSELQLGRVLPTLPRDQILVQTKIGPKPADEFVATARRSLELLRLDYVDLLAVHGVNNEDLLRETLRPGGALEGARRLQRDGRCRFIGFSTHGPTELIVRAIETGEFDYVNLHWYFVQPHTWPAVEAAARHDLGVLIISPNDKGGLLFQPSEKFVRLTAPLHPLVFNGLFCLAHPEIHTLSCGVSKPEDFNIHIETAEKSENAKDIVAPILTRLRQEEERVLGKEWLENWQTGLPEWEETPGDINIPWILRLRNLALTFDMIDFGKMRYNLLGNGGHWFPGNKADKLTEVDLSDCLKNSPFREVIPQYLAEAHRLFEGEQRKRLQQNDV